MSQTVATLKKIGQYVLQQPLRLLFIAAATLLSAAMALAAPYFIGLALDQYIIPKRYDGLLQLCMLMLAMYALGSIVSWLQAFLLADVSQRTVWSMRRDLFKHLQKLPLSFFVTRKHGDLMSRTTNDIENVTTTLNQSLIGLISSIIMLIGSLTMMLVLNVWLTLVALVVIPLIVYCSKVIAKVTRSQFKHQQKELGALNSFVEETISGQKVVSLFHQEERMAEQFNASNEKLRKVSTKAQIYAGMMGPSMNLLGHSSYLIIAAAGAWLALKDLASVGVIISFLTYSRQFSGPLNELANQYNLIQAGIAGAERVFEVMDSPSEFQEQENAVRLNEITGHIEFRHVGFQYNDEKAALKDVSFTALPGQTVAIVGPTGAGKTTIIQLLGRFFDANEGQILIDGIDIQRIDKRSLRSQLGIVLQDAHVFAGTIRENIRYGRLDASDEEVAAAARKAHAHDFIMRLPDGYDTLLSAEGSNISHGQRQLLTIARAILSEPAMLILDEATSSVDTLAELHIQSAMTELLGGRTSFVIAHRLSTIRNADLILVIDDGRVAEQGTHDELLAREGLYYSLHGNLFQEEELELA